MPCVPIFLVFVFPVVISQDNAQTNLDTVVGGEYLQSDPHVENLESDSESRIYKGVAFGSVHTLQKYAEWAAKEEDTVQMLSQRMDLLNTEYSLIQNYLADYNETTGEAMKHLKSPKNTPEERGQVVGSSAVLGHRMTKRYASIVHQLRQLLSSSEYVDNQNKLVAALNLEENETGQESGGWIGREDLFLSMTTFIHLDEVYNFSPRMLAEGLPVNGTTTTKLTALHSAEIGMLAMYRSKQSIAIEWLELAKSQIESELPVVTMDPTLVQELLSVAIQQHNIDWYRFQNEWGSVEELNMDSYFHLYMSPVTKEQSPENRTRKRHDFHASGAVFDARSLREVQFMSLCQGVVSQTPEQQMSLKCYYERHRHPYLYINPVKVEQLSESPPIYQFYEVIGNDTIEKIKEMNRHQVRLSTLVGFSQVEEVTKFRTSAGIGIDPYYATPTVVFNLAEALSGLRIWGTSEPIQFAEYTYGRFYSHHMDAHTIVKESAADYDDRLATILYYMELPEEGGNTPFLQAGINANSVRGSAVFWYNLYRNGLPRDDVVHGACPVIQGHKIIMNHWIGYIGNWDTFQCSLNEYE